MRLVSFIKSGAQSYGVMQGEMLYEASEALRAQYPDLKAVIAAGAESEVAKGAGAPMPLETVTLVSPVPNPDKILCIGLNYATHIKETGRDKPQFPAIFTRYPSSVLGHGVELIRPHISDEFDYEGELAVIIGKPGRYISEADAMDHVAGYSCFNDGTIRDFQRHTSQFWPGKSFDKTGSMGPWLVTADEVPDPSATYLRTVLNGQEVQSTPVSDLAFSIPEIIAYVSKVTELLPGDIIATGTPGGVGRFRTPPLYMKAGDVIEVEISGIGTLSNTIADEAAA